MEIRATIGRLGKQFLSHIVWTLVVDGVLVLATTGLGFLLDMPLLTIIGLVVAAALLVAALIVQWRSPPSAPPPDRDGLTDSVEYELGKGPAERADLHPSRPCAAGLPNWQVSYLPWPKELGTPGIVLEAGSTDGDERTDGWCTVVTPDGTEYEAGFLSAWAIPRHQANARERFSLTFPEHFAGAPPLPFKDGEYQFSWFGEAGLGRELLGSGCFRVSGRRVRQCDAPPDDPSPIGYLIADGEDVLRDIELGWVSVIGPQGLGAEAESWATRVADHLRASYPDSSYAERFLGGDGVMRLGSDSPPTLKDEASRDLWHRQHARLRRLRTIRQEVGEE
jgi:hypothetical protein